MANPETKQQRLPRHLIEFAVIFLSVVLAFFFEDFRESRNEKQQYKETLMIFGEDLQGFVEGLRKDIDTVRIANDWNNRGQVFEVLLNLLWIDSLIDIKEANLIDFRYIIESEYLQYWNIPIPVSPLSEEIRTRHVEHSSRSIKAGVLGIYDMEMSELNSIEQRFLNYYSSLNEIIDKTDPYFIYDAQDSLLFYSDEFIWRFKRIVKLHEAEYYYMRYLVQNRFVKVLNVVVRELERLGTDIPEDIQCFNMDNIYERFECEKGRPLDLEKDTITGISDIVSQKRNRFYKSLKN